MATIRIKTEQYSDQLIRDQQVTDAIVRGVMEGRRSALLSSNARRPLNDLGMQTHSLIVERVAVHLEPFGFSKVDKGCQVRLENYGGRFSGPVRLLMGKGRRGDVSFDLKVNKKGAYSRELIVENHPFASQLDLTDIPGTDVSAMPDGVYQNYWIIWEIAGDTGLDEVVTVYLALPEDLHPSGRVLRCAERRVLHGGTMPYIAISGRDLPDSAAIDPIIEEVDDTDDAGQTGPELD